METRGVFYEMGTNVLKMIKMSFMLQRVSTETRNLTSVSNDYQITKKNSKPSCSLSSKPLYRLVVNIYSHESEDGLGVFIFLNTY